MQMVQQLHISPLKVKYIFSKLNRSSTPAEKCNDNFTTFKDKIKFPKLGVANFGGIY